MYSKCLSVIYKISSSINVLSKKRRSQKATERSRADSTVGNIIFFLTNILKGTVFFFRVLQTNETLKSKPRGKRGVLPIMDYIGRGAFFGLQLFTC